MLLENMADLQDFTRAGFCAPLSRIQYRASRIDSFHTS